ncbi:hypothetical protein SUGI_0572330 [Cryptomeria japonica]|nr:hypothetical protein SUGI_0572330 [Cryptomeria japonica]
MTVRAQAAKYFSMVSMPVEKTGFIHCPVSPLVLLSHDYGILDILKAGEYLTSANKRVGLVMQRDCNLVLTDTLRNWRMWSSNTGGFGNSCFLCLQSDANLVILYNRNQYNPVWATNQGCGRLCCKFSSLVVEDDGNLVVYRSQNSRLKAVLSTNTRLVQ